MRQSVSFTIDQFLLTYLRDTQGRRSKSQRVNELLRRAILQERYEKLEQEAGEFFASPPEAARSEAKAFQDAAIKSIARD